MAIKKYKKAKIYRGKTGDPKEKWYVSYSFLNPFTAKFDRFRAYEGINYIDDLQEKEAFANELANEINARLIAGYDPFMAEQKTNEIIHDLKAEAILQENQKSPTLLDAFKIFINKKEEKNLAKDSMTSYNSYIAKFENYLFENRLADVRLNSIDTKFISDMLSWMKGHHNWNETTYNNHLRFWVTLLNWFAKAPRKWIRRDDFHIGADSELEQKVARPMKHQYFGETVGNAVKEEFKKFPKMEFYSKFIYFSCMRPDEIRNLKIENVDLNGRYMKIVGKTKSRTVPICDELSDMLESLNLEKYPANYYVIGKSGGVDSAMHSENYFSRPFREDIKEKLGLSKDFTLYGWKHTRVVDLLNAGYSDAEIMNLTGHTDTSSYDKYKRDLVNHIKTRLRGKTIGW
ncbi:tyrosine-type recombinase/integrase [Pedobacter zeae]|uniref:Integrase n=1 Tax=Pedobacter zeae TaxID=1737356 RepID=A0A7W6P4N0_9SPHI|nr:site-specific integrase [Pedobacter zeae]MBB4107764.1 integrase [Pedobacter zeae]GGG97205.1 hypothetical protein GCM10007422_08900 [Pedobacter zeae]